MAKITVTSSDLKKKMGDLQSDNGKLMSELKNLDNIKAALEAAWEGDASDAFKGKYAKERPYFDTFVKLVDSYVTTCNTIISNYENAESKNASIAK